MKKPTRRPLSLAAETIRVLARDELKIMAGGQDRVIAHSKPTICSTGVA